MRITIKSIEYVFDNQYTHHHGTMMTLTSINNNIEIISDDIVCRNKS